MAEAFSTFPHVLSLPLSSILKSLNPAGLGSVDKTFSFLHLGPMLNRTSFNFPNKSVFPKSGSGTPISSTKSIEVVPDSEEERVRIEAPLRIPQKPKEVIVISSDEDEEVPVKNSPLAKKTPRTKSIAKSRRIVESSSESEGELSVQVKGKNKTKESGANSANSAEVIVVPPLSLYQDDEESTDDVFGPSSIDEAIIVYDEPRSPRKPMRVPSLLPQLNTAALEGSISNPATPTKKKGGKASSTAIGSTTPAAGTSTQSSPSKRKLRVSKKAEEEARLAGLIDYAQAFFHEMNTAVFENGLPKQTQLIWNKKLCTTAGKAKWNKNRNGVGFSQIELAPKILDCEERIRKTLAHEMCHLACWIIDGNMKENHGPLFKTWASRVTKARPDITVSTTHDYEINHPYRWKCADCDLIYGRFSKSIKSDESRCGKCGRQDDPKRGILTPLHKERPKKAPEMPVSKSSRMAAGKPRDSPSSIIRQKTPSFTCRNDTPVSDDDQVELVELFCDVSTSISAGGCSPFDVGSDPDIEFIAMAMKGATLRK
ncbi:hypothetical protein E1B28_009811 [Marasmius oreades]|uniref:SprT-like domain-containing protein n=1 Tax=Marasmius oreades TaxID=181124 RepID=A0A9P7RVV8_9AGAR|nr:uncharacterized protein E1B28_009811 [Marasmius oreades]KAG7090719.1 hypothetical protein E1B28_009811 [Marasmius oreades]